jgi:hypothetical protein
MANIRRQESYTRQLNYLSIHGTLLGQLKAMWEDPMVQLYNDQDLPMNLSKGSVFLAGPTSRNQVLECQWRAQAVHHLRQDYDYDGWIFCPEPRGLEYEGDFTERKYIHKWESDRLKAARHTAFWIPRKADELLGLNTNLELGMSIKQAELDESYRKRLFVGWPHEAERMGLPNHYMEIAGVYRYTTLEELCQTIGSSHTK